MQIPKIPSEELLKQVDALEKQLQKATTAEAVNIYSNLTYRLKRKIIQRNNIPEVIEAYNKAMEEKAKKEAEQAFSETWNSKIENIYKAANNYSMIAQASRQIIPAFKELDKKTLTIKIESVLQKYNNNQFVYKYIKYDLHIEIRAYYTESNNFCILSIDKPNRKFLYDKNKINGEAIINHLTSIADEHDQTAAEARKEALTLIDKVRKLNHYLKKAEAIQKEIQKNTIIRRETFDFFQYKRY